MIRIVFSLLVLCLPSIALGQTSCLPEFTSLQAMETVNPDYPRGFTHPLLAEGPVGRFATRAILQARPGLDPLTLELKVLFDPEFDGVSLAYNLYAAQVLIDGVPEFFMDYTNGCQGPGKSIFPGGQIRLPSVKLIGGKAQRLQIMVWGKL